MMLCLHVQVGVGIAGDVSKVLKDYSVSVNAFQDLSELANQKLALPRYQWSLASLSEVLINKQVIVQLLLQSSWPLMSNFLTAF